MLGRVTGHSLDADVLLPAPCPAFCSASCLQAGAAVWAATTEQAELLWMRVGKRLLQDAHALALRDTEALAGPYLLCPTRPTQLAALGEPMLFWHIQHKA